LSKEYFLSEPAIWVEVKNDEGWFGATFPDGVDELYFHYSGLLTDQQMIKDLFNVFTLILQRLVQMDSASPDSPNIRL
jgi:hypothetical protein